jgi:hypothetical protein
MTSRAKVSGAAIAAALSTLVAFATQAQAQDDDYYYGAPADYGQYGAAQGEAQQEPPIPPYVEGAPIAAQGGGYCYVGPHPVDTRVVPGPAFENAQGQNIRPYPPVDLRLFSYHQGCYYFIGDPRDFGYGGQVYSYYGAHPVLDAYGGGWCFMMGGHNHLWQPWSPYFTVVGPWNYWYGPYDPFFWSYWPYYSFYYRSYYPTYYGGGRFYRGGGYRAAPPISRVPATAFRGAPPGTAGGGFRGTPPTGAAAAGGWRGAPPSTGGAASPAPFRSTTPFRAPAPSVGSGFRASPPGGGFSGGFRGGGRRR